MAFDRGSEGRERPSAESGCPRAADAHFHGRPAKCLALVVAELEKAAFGGWEGPELDRDPSVNGIVRFDRDGGHWPAVPSCVVVNLMPVNELDSPAVADTIDSEAAIGAATEPMVRPNTVEDRTLNPAASEHGEGYVPPVKSHRRFHKALGPVGDQVIELYAGRHWPRVDAAGYRAHEVKVSPDACVSRYTIDSGRSLGRVGRRDTLHGIAVLGPQRPL